MTTVRLQDFPVVTAPNFPDLLYLSKSGIESQISLANLLVYLAQSLLSTANNLSELTATSATARANILAAKSAINADITQLTGLTTALSVLQGGTGVTTATGTDSVVRKNGPTLINPTIQTDLALVGTLSVTGGAGTVGQTLTSAGPGVSPAWVSPAPPSFTPTTALGVLAFLNQ